MSDATRTCADILRDIVADWTRDEHHDVPLALIDEARAVLGGLCPTCRGNGVITVRESGSNRAIGTAKCPGCSGTGSVIPQPPAAVRERVAKAIWMSVANHAQILPLSAMDWEPVWRDRLTPDERDLWRAAADVALHVLEGS